MRTPENRELTDLELSDMLGTWRVPDPSPSLRTRVFSETKGASMNVRIFSFNSPAVLQEPWYKSLYKAMGELVRPQTVEPLQVTSKPVEVGSLWGAYAGGERRSGAASVLIHVGAVALLLLVFQTPAVVRKIKDTRLIYIAEYMPKRPAAAQQSGGGGGGQKMTAPASQGAAPKFAARQFTPPMLAVAKPLLPLTPTITAQVPQITADNYGDPLSKMLPASGGPGSNGLGAGSGGGVGNGHGDGFGPGSGGGSSGGVYSIGGDVSAPTLISKVEPEYSEEARKAKYSGVVVLSTVVDEHGIPRDIHVVRPLGLGLDEKAISAVAHWRFRPAFRQGKPVAVVANVEVYFRLL